MGEPIQLVREEETMTVYGPNQAQVMRTQGWTPAHEGDANIISGVDDLTVIKGVGVALAAVLADAGYRSYISIVNAETEKLISLDKISPLTAQKIQKNASELVVA
jgi:predicted flap endonuclease-1-like 5' DNA nuclease